MTSVPTPNQSSPAPALDRSLLAWATQGHRGQEELRLRTLLQSFTQVAWFPFDRNHKFRTLRALWRQLRKRPHLAIMEGSGMAGALPMLLARLCLGVPYVVSSGDAIAPYLTARLPLLRPLFAFYERCLYRNCAGFIGWTPYLTGRALTYGAPRAMTAPGFASFSLSPDQRLPLRRQMRARLGIPDSALVLGLAGALIWNPRYRYCYGWELVQAALAARRDDLYLLIVGDGSGLPHLRAAAAPLGARVIFPGRVPMTQVPEFLAAMDVGSLPQSLNRVGAFRFTTKISEYWAAGLPIVTGQLPLAYDLTLAWSWRLPGAAPWHSDYIQNLARWVDQLSEEQLLRKASALPAALPEFDSQRQASAVTAFLTDILHSQNGPH